LRQLNTDVVVTPPPRLQGVGVRAVSAGGSHSVVLGGDGHVYTCGLNDHGQLGHSPTANFVPRAVRVEAGLIQRPLSRSS